MELKEQQIGEFHAKIGIRIVGSVVRIENFTAAFGRLRSLITSQTEFARRFPLHRKSKRVWVERGKSTARQFIDLTPSILNIYLANPPLNQAKSSDLLNVLLNFLLQLDRICTNKFINFLSILENHKCRHSANSILLSEVGELIDIDFEVCGIGITFREFHNLGSNDSARTAPSCVKINDANALFDRLLKIFG